MDIKITVRTPEEKELANRIADAVNAAGERGMSVGAVINVLDLIRSMIPRASTAHAWEAETSGGKPKREATPDD